MLFTCFLREFKTTFNCKISFCYGFNKGNEKIATLWERVLTADTIDLNGGHFSRPYRTPKLEPLGLSFL